MDKSISSKLESEYTVYFELYGHKMKLKTFAFNESHARQIVQNKIKFHKILKEKSDTNEIVDMINNLSSPLNSDDNIKDILP